MQMGDKIVVMNNAVVEQFGTPQQIYDKPATMFVANFIGSPSMNFLSFEGAMKAGDTSLQMHGSQVAIPRTREGFNGAMVFGVRPEHIQLKGDGAYRGEVLATEYLGTTQIVTLATAGGEVKARTASQQTAKVGETLGLHFDPQMVTLFDPTSGRAFKSELNEGVLDG